MNFISKNQQCLNGKEHHKVKRPMIDLTNCVNIWELRVSISIVQREKDKIIILNQITNRKMTMEQ